MQKLQEIIHRGVRFEMFKKSAHWQSGTCKYPGAAHALITSKSDFIGKRLKDKEVAVGTRITAA